MAKTDQEFRAMTKKEVTEYAKSLEEKAGLYDHSIETLAKTQENLDLTQEEAANMSETIRRQNAKMNANAGAVTNLLNGINLAVSNATAMLETLGLVQKGGQE